MREKVENVSGVFLAGGKSRRMGRDKRELKINGESLFERGLRAFEQLFDEVQIVVAEMSPIVQDSTHSVVTDLVPQCGSAGGLYTGLFHSTNPNVFVAACDMPFLNNRLIRYLCGQAGGFDVVMVKLSSGLQPTHGVYSKRCLPVFEHMIKTREFRLQEIVYRKDLSVRIVEEKEIGNFDPYFSIFS